MLVFFQKKWSWCNSQGVSFIEVDHLIGKVDQQSRFKRVLNAFLIKANVPTIYYISILQIQLNSINFQIQNLTYKT